MLFNKLLALVLVLCLISTTILGQTPYIYKRYPFKKKQKNEKRLKTLRKQCEADDECLKLVGIEQMKCIRICMSLSCYNELYGHDELEEGEIDVRFNSFKGCVYQGLPKIQKL